MNWNDLTKEQPTKDDRYAVIFQQGPVVRRFIADYSVEDGWMLGLPDVEIIAWAPLPEIPEWVIKKFSEAA